MLRRQLSNLAGLLPSGSEALYLILRFLYRRMPLPLESKLPWAQKLLSCLPGLRQAAFKIADRNPPNFAVSPQQDMVAAQEPLRGPDRRILVVEHRLPTPDRNSSSVRMFALLTLLRQQDWQVTFVSDSQPSDYQTFGIEGELGLATYEQALSRLRIRWIFGMQALIQHLLAEGDRYRYAILSYPEIMHLYSPLVRAFMRNAELVYDTVDLHGMRFRREALTKGSHAGLLEKAEYYDRLEAANAESADIVLTVTEDERDEMRRLAATDRIVVVPNVHAIVSPTTGPEGREGLLFIGHYLHTPNEDAVVYFLKEILPRIRDHLPAIPFYVLGSSMPEDLRCLASERVHMVGYVEDPMPWFEKARVFVAPLRFGAGMKGKIGQSLGAGLPVVTTSIGAEGMDLEDGVNASIADGVSDFATAVIRLHRDDDLWRVLAENGKAHIARRFSHEAVRESLVQLFAFDERPASLLGLS